MAVISPSAKVQEPAKFINEQLNVNPGKPLSSLLDEAGMRFNLTPLDTESLQRIFSQKSNTF